MKFLPASLSGAFVVEQERWSDARGYFARTFCIREFEARGLETRFVQSNVSLTLRTGTVRGLHFQKPPHGEVKLVRCSRGRLYDVIVDLRAGSSTFGQWFGQELSAENGLMMYVPIGFAHGYQTLSDDVEISYQVSEYYAPDAEGGLRADDPAIGVRWPLPIAMLSEKDRSWKTLEQPIAPIFA